MPLPQCLWMVSKLVMMTRATTKHQLVLIDWTWQHYTQSLLWWCFFQAGAILQRRVIAPRRLNDPNLVHYILWPVISSLLILAILIILLYFVSTVLYVGYYTHRNLLRFQVGFFRRKKKPSEGELMGDTDPDAPPQIGTHSYEKPTEKATTVWWWLICSIWSILTHPHHVCL